MSHPQRSFFTPRRHARRGVRAVLCVGAAALVAAPAARAEYRTVTVQAQRAHAEWLAFAPPPDGGAAAVCLVDTGVDLNPDTESNVVDRSTLDGGPAGDGGASHHGTTMAMTMGAARNDWGMVGAWPQLKIVDVRAVDPGTDSFQYGNYRLAINTCRAKAAAFRIKVVNLSIAGDPDAPTDIDRARLADAVEAARGAGLDVVAAAGNHGGPVEAPGDYGSIFTVAAGDEGGRLCSFASRGPAVDLLAPGCGLDGAFPDGSPAVNASGSSQASAFTSAVIAALRSYKPTLTVDEAEGALVASADHGPDGATLNVEAAFVQVGLADVVAQARSAEAAALSPSTPAPAGTSGGTGGSSPIAAPQSDAEAPATPQPVAPAPVQPPPSVSVRDVESAPRRLPNPRARRLRHGRHGWRLTLKNRPHDALAVVTIYARGRARTRREFPFAVKRLQVLGSIVVVHRRSWHHLTVRYRDGFNADSALLTVRRPRTKRRTRHREARRGHRAVARHRRRR